MQPEKLMCPLKNIKNIDNLSLPLLCSRTFPFFTCGGKRCGRQVPLRARLASNLFKKHSSLACRAVGLHQGAVVAVAAAAEGNVPGKFLLCFRQWEDRSYCETFFLPELFFFLCISFKDKYIFCNTIHSMVHLYPRLPQIQTTDTSAVQIINSEIFIKGLVL